jgi:gentisate 1,2-dioxygenase
MHITPTEHNALHFLDHSGQGPRSPRIWEPMLVTKEAIDAEIARLVAIPAPVNGKRSSVIVHPASRTAKGTCVAINVLLPGEKTAPSRSNANLLEVCIQGRGRVTVDGSFEPVLNDVWTVPSMRGHLHENTDHPHRVDRVGRSAGRHEHLRCHQGGLPRHGPCHGAGCEGNGDPD